MAAGFCEAMRLRVDGAMVGAANKAILNEYSNATVAIEMRQLPDWLPTCANESHDQVPKAIVDSAVESMRIAVSVAVSMESRQRTADERSFIEQFSIETAKSSIQTALTVGVGPAIAIRIISKASVRGAVKALKKTS